MIRFLVVCIENFPKSEQIHFLFNFSQTDEVVPLPTKKSHTKSPSFEDAFTNFSTNTSYVILITYIVKSNKLFIFLL